MELFARNYSQRKASEQAVSHVAKLTSSETITLGYAMELKNMEHRVVRLDLSSPDKPSFAICEVFTDDSGEVFHYALNGACITAESPAKIAIELDLMRKATQKPVLLESDMKQITDSDIAQQLGH